jgi:Mce-associated membrane protein
MTTLRENIGTGATGDKETVIADAEDSAEAMSEELEPTAEDQAAQEDSEAANADEASDGEPDSGPEKRAVEWSRVLAHGVLPAIALLLALGAGYFKWVVGSADDLARARTESVRVAGEDTVVLLSYKADSVEKDLAAARERLTGEFKDAYTELTRQVVIPGAKEKHISSVAKVNAAASVSATANHAVVLLFVDQTVTIGAGAPTDTQPVVRVTLDKVNGRWLVSRFDPV